MSIMERRREDHDPEEFEQALEAMKDRDDRVGRLCRMMLDEDDYDSLEDSEK